MPTPAGSSEPRPEPDPREAHERWLLELTGIPTAAGREDRVIAWIEGWLEPRPHLHLTRDRAGNLLIHAGAGLSAAARSAAADAPRPLYFTAHLDHPAFIVRERLDDRTLALEFRGGVRDAFFENAKIEVIDVDEVAHAATITELDASAKPFKRVIAKLAREAGAVAAGDVARWKLPPPCIIDGLLHAPACDDLAAVAAALAAFDTLQRQPGCEHVGLLLTRAEEVGFIGAIAAAKQESVPREARLICLENSSSFADSPIGGGAIVRVGDRLSVFDNELTDRISRLMANRAEQHEGFRYQRKLMPGGACEATAFAAYGYHSTCLCLPLGNYHNMVSADEVATGQRSPELGPEFIAVSDFHGLIEMLIIIAQQLDSPETPTVLERLDRLYEEHAFVLQR